MLSQRGAKLTIMLGFLSLDYNLHTYCVMSAMMVLEIYGSTCIISS